MQVRALKTFRDKNYGVGANQTVRTGLVLTVPEHQYLAWTRVRPPLVEKFAGPDLNAAEPGPSDNKSIPRAPATKGPRKAEPEQGNGQPSSVVVTPADTAKGGRKGGGKAKRSLSAPPGQA